MENELQVLQEEINQIDWHDDYMIRDFINNNNFEIFTAKNQDGETVIFGIVQGKRIEITTYQKNGWIRINVYTIDNDSPIFIIGEEFYKK